jgi:epoxyqueuosine reductase QueG
MSRWHPSREQLERFLLEGLPPEETSRVMQHLVQGCGRCQEVTGSIWPFGSDPEKVASKRFEYSDAMSRVFSAARRARADLEAGQGEAARLEALLRASQEATDPERAVAAAESAVAVAEALGEDHPAPVAEDLRARAWGALAEARRLAADLAGAEEALRTSLEHLGRGTGCRLGKARLLEVEAALRAAQGRSEEADRLSRRAARLYGR